LFCLFVWYWGGISKVGAHTTRCKNHYMQEALHARGTTCCHQCVYSTCLFSLSPLGTSLTYTQKLILAYT
jgi:hypothetical protein